MITETKGVVQPIFQGSQTKAFLCDFFLLRNIIKVFIVIVAVQWLKAAVQQQSCRFIVTTVDGNKIHDQLLQIVVDLFTWIPNDPRCCGTFKRFSGPTLRNNLYSGFGHGKDLLIEGNRNHHSNCP